MLKTKTILCIVLILLIVPLMVTMIPMTRGDIAKPLKVEYKLNNPHSTHKPPIQPNWFWEWTAAGWQAHTYGGTGGDEVILPGPDPSTTPDYILAFPEVITDTFGHRLGKKLMDTTNATIERRQNKPWPGIQPAPVPSQYIRIEVDAGMNAGYLEVHYGRKGPKIDLLRAKVIKSPDAQLIAMQTEEGVVLTDLIRTGDIEKLDGDGFTITAAPGFHMGHIGYNIRPDQSYKTITNPDAAYVLSDVNFRHALFHLYNQDEILASIYSYIVTKSVSLVPPAQGGWVNPEVPLHPFNPGDKTATTEYDPETGENEDACSILRYGGYLYDATLDNWVTPYDIDGDGTPGTNHPARPLEVLDPDDVVPYMQLWTPTYEVAPTSAQHGAWFVSDLNTYGLTSIEHVPREFDPYTSDVFDLGDFDMYMVFWRLGRFPDHLETMCHSDHDVVEVPGDYNAPGCNDPELDEAVRTIITSLDHDEKMAAAYKAQNILYNESYPNAAFSYMQLYSRTYFNAFNPDLRGIVNSPGYGSDNGWTHLNLHWAEGLERIEDGRTIIEWIWGEEPELLNPCSATTVYAWDIIDKTLDGLIWVNPYTHEDMPGMAEDWSVVEWPNQGPYNNETWMNVTFTLRKDIFWQDGNPFVAEDVKFNWLFLRNNEIPRYMGMWQWLVDVEVIDDYTVRAIMNTTSQFLLYDLAGTAALLPPPVWSWLDGKPLDTIMQYNPSTNTTKPTDAGPWFGAGTGFPGTQLYGTGAFVFEYYDPTLMVADLGQFVGYHKTTEEISDLKVEMFHEIGDVNRDGYIDVFDLSRLGVSYGKFSWMPGYDPDADLNQDGVVDARDLALITWHWGEQREYPEP
jgi:ABC-type transport system substrate-binding protein